MLTKSEIMETYRRANEEERCEMWLVYRGLRPQFEAIEFAGTNEVIEPEKPRLLARCFSGCRRLFRLSPSMR